MARAPVADVRITEGLRPQATPIDTYSRPAAQTDNPLSDIARSLGPLSSQLAQWGREQDAIKEDEAVVRGQAAFYANNQAGYEEATRKGLVPGYASKGYVDGYKAAEGAAAGRELDIKLGAAYEQWNKGFDDPRGFEKWIGPQIQAMVSTNDPAVLKGLMPHIRAASDKYQAQWLSDRAKDTEYRAVSAYGAAVGSTLDTYARDGLSRQEGTDVAGAAATVQSIRDSAFKAGIPTDKVDKQMVDAITSSAIKNEDPSLLKLLDGKSVGGTTLGDTPYGRAQKMEATNTLRALYRQQDEVMRRRQEQVDKEVHNKALSVVTESLMKNPDAVIPDEVLKTIEKRDGDFRVKLMEWRKSIRENGNAEDELKVGTLYTDLMNGAGMDAVMTAIGNQVIKKPETIAKAVTFAKEWDRFKDSPQAGILQDQMFKDIRTIIYTRGADTNALNPLQSERILTQSGRAALNDATQAAIKWASENPDASILERAKFLGSLQEVVAKSFVEDKQGNTAYARPDGFADTFRDNPAAPPEQQGPPASAPSSRPLPQRTTSGPKPITPDEVGAPGSPERDLLETRAKKLGVDPQMLLNKVWERAQRERDGTQQLPPAAQPQSMQPGGPGTDPIPARPQAARMGGSSVVSLPGGVQLSLDGLDQATSDQLRTSLQGVFDGIRGYANLGAGGPESASGRFPGAAPSRAVWMQQNAPEVSNVITAEAQRAGMDPNILLTIANIESSGNPKLQDPGSSYRGLFQLSDQEMAKYGGGNIFDPAANTRAAIASLKEKAALYQQKFGQPPSATMLYLMHQQGEGGLFNHMASPNASAIANMAATAEGRAKGRGWATAAVLGNIPKDVRGLLPANPNQITSAQFLAIWRQKVEGVPYREALAQIEQGRG